MKKIKELLMNYWMLFIKECIQAWNIVKQDVLNAWYFLKKKCIRLHKKVKRISINSILWKIYKKIDRGEPSWLSLFGEIRFSLTIPIKEIHNKRMKRIFLKSILPNYVSADYDNFIFLHTYKIPEGSNAIMEVRKLKELMLENGFEKKSRVENNEADSFSCEYYHPKYKGVHVFVYMDDVCDIEYIDVVKQEPIVTGMCAKILEELNTN